MTTLLTVLVPLLDEAPAPEDTKAGGTAFLVFVLLGAAVVLLALSLNKHLRKTRANFEARDRLEAPDREDRA